MTAILIRQIHRTSYLRFRPRERFMQFVGQGVEDGAKVTVTADDLAWAENTVRQERSEQEAVRKHLKQAWSAAIA